MLEKNAEGYWDPTAAQALKRIRTEEKKKRRALRQTLSTPESDSTGIKKLIRSVTGLHGAHLGHRATSGAFEMEKSV